MSHNQKATKDGLANFEERLCGPVVSDIRAWESHVQLRPLLEKLQSVTKPHQFLDHYAEALIARYLVNIGGSVDVEVPNGLGKCADFKFLKDGRTMFLHLKRLNPIETHQKQGSAASRLFIALQKIRRPLWVNVELLRNLNDEAARDLSKKVEAFALAGSVGELREFCDAKGNRLAKAQIVCAHNQSHVLAMIVHPFCLADDQQRLDRNLSKAYRQFVPRELNLIAISASLESSFEDLELALRSRNGFWHDQEHPESRLVIWFSYSLKQDRIAFRLLFRVKEDASSLRRLLEIFPQAQDEFRSKP